MAKHSGSHSGSHTNHSNEQSKSGASRDSGETQGTQSRSNMGSSASSSMGSRAGMSAQDFAQNMADTAERAFGDVAGRLRERFSDLPDYSRDFIGRVDRSARSNPWIGIGLAGVGAFALGYVLAKSFSSDSSPSMEAASTMGSRSSLMDLDDLEVDD